MLVIIAFVVGGYLAGILGLFVAVPVAATLRILFLYAQERIYA
jgi:predicted PurR-regulated permease PerM